MVSFLIFFKINGDFESLRIYCLGRVEHAVVKPCNTLTYEMVIKLVYLISYIIVQQTNVILLEKSVYKNI